MIPATLLVVLAQAAQPPTAPEALVAAALEDVRKAELLLDADALSELLAASFTIVGGDARISGAFAYLEPIRRLRARGAEVSSLTHDTVSIKVYGGSAIASYVFHKHWREGKRRHREEGWTSDVFELRDDGRWLLVHRHRTGS